MSDQRRHEAVIVTAPVDYPITLAQAKAYASVTDDASDTLIETLLAGAVDYFQERTGHQLIQATYSQMWDGFPCWEFEFDLAPVRSVSWLKYYDVNGVLTTLDPTGYWTSLRARPPVVMPRYGTIWPITQYGRPESVEIQYVAGYEFQSDIRTGIRAAIMEIVKHWYVNRIPVVTEGGIPKDVPHTLNSLMGLYNMRGFR